MSSSWQTTDVSISTSFRKCLVWFVIWPIWAHISKNHNFGAESKMVPSRDHVVQKRWSCEVVGSDQISVFPGWSRFVLGKLCFSNCWFDSHPCHHGSGSFAWLGSHPSLATRKDATVEVVLATCHKCSSKLRLLFGPFGPTSLQQKAGS